MRSAPLLHRTLGFTATQPHRGGLGSTKSQEGWVWITPSRQSPTCSSLQIANRVTVAQFSLTMGTGSSPSHCPHPYSTGGLQEHLAQPQRQFQGLPAGRFPLELGWAGPPQTHHHLPVDPRGETLTRCLPAGR